MSRWRDWHGAALTLAFCSFGERWYAALVVAWLDNVRTTDQMKYFNSRGAELCVQWEIRDRWWLIAGGNWLKPDREDSEAGEYQVDYGVIGLRYTFDSFNRMLYAEYRLNRSRLWDGTPLKNELTVGVRWDFGY